MGLVGRRCILLRRAWSGAGTASRAFGWPYFAGGGFGRLQARSTSRPGACSAEGGLCFDGLGHQQAGSASNSRRAWLATRELCFGLGQPQAASASKGLYSAAYSRSLVGGRSAQTREGLLPNF